MSQVLQDFLEQNKESETIRNSDTDFQVEKFKELAEELTRWNEADLYASSPDSSECSTGSTLPSSVQRDDKEECEAEISVLDSEQLESKHNVAEKNVICHTDSTNEGINIMKDFLTH